METIKQEIVNKAMNEFAPTFNEFYTLEYCSKSSYFVYCVTNRISEIAFFDFDWDEYTKDDLQEMVDMFFAA